MRGEGEKEGEKARALVPLHVLKQGSDGWEKGGGGGEWKKWDETTKRYRCQQTP